jgi:hypothetical protein
MSRVWANTNAWCMRSPRNLSAADRLPPWGGGLSPAGAHQVEALVSDLSLGVGHLCHLTI